jgi:hypothetical protein
MPAYVFDTSESDAVVWIDPSHGVAFLDLAILWTGGCSAWSAKDTRQRPLDRGLLDWEPFGQPHLYMILYWVTLLYRSLPARGKGEV